MASVVERRIQSFMDDPSNMNQPNLIHSTAGAQAFGFADALVTGSIVYGWAVPAILDALGNEWLQQGWADVRFRRPVYPNDELTVRLREMEDGAWSLEVFREGDELTLVGAVGRGLRSDLVDDFRESPRVPVVSTPNPPPLLTPDTVPVGQQLPTHETSLDAPAVPPSEASTRVRLQGVLLDGAAHANPAGVSGRMSWYGHASYDYAGPSIHTRTQAQYFAPALSGEPLEVAAVVRDGYQRNGHEYIVYDGTIRNRSAELLAHVRHTVIFRVAGQGDAR